MDAKTIKYNNGSVLIYKKDTRQKSVFIEFCFHAGLFNDPNTKLGLSHVIEHVLGLSNNEFSHTQKVEIIRKKYYICNFSTGNENISLYAHVSRDQIDDLFRDYSNFVSSFNIDNKEFENEKLIIKQEIINGINNNISKDVLETRFKSMYKNHKYVGIGAYGTIETVDSITKQDVENFIKKVFAVNNLQITVCGNINLGYVKKLIKKYVFASITNKTDMNFKLASTIIQKMNKPNMLVHSSREGVKSHIEVIHNIKFDKVVDEYNYLTKVISYNLESAAFNYFRNTFALAYSANTTCNYYTTYDEEIKSKIGYIKFSTKISCDQNNVNNILNLLPGYYEYLKNYLIDSETLKIIRDNIKHFEDCMDKDSIRVIGTTLSKEYFKYGTITKYKHIKYLNNLKYKCTPEQFNCLFKEILKQKPYIIVVTNCKDKIPIYSKLCKDIKNSLKWIM